MKVFFTLDSLANAGTEKSTLDILSHFKEIEVKVICLSKVLDLMPAYQKAGIPLHFPGTVGEVGIIKGTINLIKIIRQEKPDLLISSLMRSNFITRFAGLLTGTPVIGTFVSDSYNKIRIADMRRKKRYVPFRFFWLMDRFTSGIPLYWISNAISIAKGNTQALKINKRKIKVIYRGRDTSLFPLWQPSDRKTFHFIFIGRVMEIKGIPEMLEAVKVVKENNADITLDIYGEGSFRKKAELMIEQLGLQDTVTLHGKVLDGWKKLYSADCFVFPSRNEGFSGALVEAIIAGIPVIASDIPMNLEAVNNKTALIFPVQDAESLAGCMKRMMENYQAMIANALHLRETAIRKFDIKVIAEQYEGFLKQVINKTVDNASLV